jgi:hypothetical protein
LGHLGQLQGQDIYHLFMHKYLVAIVGKDNIKKRIVRGALGGVIGLLLSALGGGFSGEQNLFVVLFLFLFVGVPTGVLTPIALFRLIGLLIIFAGCVIVFGLTVEPMSKGQGIYFILIGLIPWWKFLKSLFKKDISN